MDHLPLQKRKTDQFAAAKVFAAGGTPQQKRLQTGHQAVDEALPPKQLITTQHVKSITALMAKGFTLYAACGKLDIQPNLLAAASAADPTLTTTLELARLKRLYYLEEGLLNTNMAARVTARVFALKNAEPTLWQDRPSAPIAVGISANIVIVTGVPEATAPPPILVEHIPNDDLFKPDADADS